MKTLSIVLPAYNEQKNISRTSNILIEKINELVIKNKISNESFIVFIDDGSRDNTWEEIIKQNQKNPKVQGVKLSRNFGHQSALLAGLQFAHKISDFVLSMDADLQHDPEAIEQFIDLANSGYEIVYGVRENRSDESKSKKILSSLFYKLMKKLGTNVIENHADFRLMSKRAIVELFNYNERNLFLRGVIPTLGFKNTILKYKQLNREHGISNYSFSKMLNLAINGITSFSTRPLHFIFLLGISASFLSFLGILYSLYSYITHKTVAGWSSIIIAIYFIGGVQLTCIGILGEYIGKIYSETKRRPQYIIEGVTDSI